MNTDRRFCTRTSDYQIYAPLRFVELKNQKESGETHEHFSRVDDFNAILIKHTIDPPTSLTMSQWVFPFNLHER